MGRRDFFHPWANAVQGRMLPLPQETLVVRDVGMGRGQPEEVARSATRPRENSAFRAHYVSRQPDLPTSEQEPSGNSVRPGFAFRRKTNNSQGLTTLLFPRHSGSGLDEMRPGRICADPNPPFK